MDKGTSPLISLLIIAYNVENFIGECLESLIKQTYENLEIIVVDDGATDSTGDIADKYANRDTRIKVIHQSNGGISAARNTALGHFTGQYLMLLDSDDTFESDMVDKLFNALSENEADISMCGIVEMNEDGTFREKIIGLSKSTEIWSSQDLLLRMLDVGGIDVVVCWNKLFKRELLEHIRFPEGRIADDEATTYKIIYQAKKIVRIPEVLCHYRQRGSSYSYNPKHTFNEDLLTARREWIAFFEANHESRLYRASVYNYLKKLISMSMIAYKNNERDKYKSYKKRARSEYQRLAKTCRLSTKENLGIITFVIHPNCYRVFLSLWMKIRKH